MNLPTIAATVVALLVAYFKGASTKFAQKFGEGVGESAWNRTAELVNKIKAKFTANPETAKVFEALKSHPDDPEIQAAARFHLKGMLEADQKFAGEVSNILNSGEMGNFLNVFGDIYGDPMIVYGPTGYAHQVVIGKYVQYQVEGKSVEVRPVYLDLKLPNGKYPTQYWKERLTANDYLADKSKAILAEKWEPEGYDYEVIKGMLISEINKWIIKGWQLVESDIDALWVVKEYRRYTASTDFARALFGPLVNTTWKHKRVYFGAKFHIRKLSLTDSLDF